MTSEEKLESCKHVRWKAMEGFSEVEASHRVCEITGKALVRPYIVKNGVNADGSHYCILGEFPCGECKEYAN